MPNDIPSEIFWLTLVTAYSGVLFLPYAYFRIRRIGLYRLLADPLPGDDPFDTAWPHRAYRAHMNAIENIAIFAPLAIAVHVTGSSNETTEIAAAVYFFARLIHTPFYILKTPFVRTIAYFTGVGATLVLAYQILA